MILKWKAGLKWTAVINWLKIHFSKAFLLSFPYVYFELKVTIAFFIISDYNGFMIAALNFGLVQELLITFPDLVSSCLAGYDVFSEHVVRST